MKKVFSPADFGLGKLFYDISDAVIAMDTTTGRICLWNPAAEQLFGYSSEEALGMLVADLMPVEYKEKHSAGVKAYSESGKGLYVGSREALALPAVRRDGQTITIELTINPANMPGLEKFVLAIVRDTTSRSQMEKSLAAREEQLASAQRIARLGSWEWDIKSNRITWSDELYRIFDVDPSGFEATYAAYIERIHPHDLDLVRSNIEAAFETFESFEFDHQIVRPDGTTRWVHSTGEVQVEQDVPVVMRGTAIDITERRQAQEAEARLAAIIQSTDLSVTSLTPDGIIETWNPGAERLYGYTAEEIVGKPYRILVPDFELERHYKLFDSVRDGLSVGGFEMQRVTKQGSMIYVSISAAPLMDSSGRLVAISAISFDVTSQKSAERASEEAFVSQRLALQRMEQVDEMKNAIMAAVSHDLRTPLTSVLGYALTLQKEDRFTAEQRADMINRLVSNARKLDRILADLLDLDRLARGTLEPQRVEANVTKLAREVAGNLEGPVGAVQVEGEDVIGNVDAPKVERIIENLLVNAVRHTPEGTPVRIRVTVGGNGILITVEDEGKGVPDDLKESIFEPFQRGEALDHSPGSGIGLSLVSRFAELHGGKAWVEDREGGGAAFKVLLPT
ncbi:MAG TPA: PAS domain S-box protein [Actinomycetota bacterium]|nr:PAS domain S-box protein [Actinomycetota bacterium]